MTTEENDLRDAVIVATDHDRRLDRIEAEIGTLDDGEHAALIAAAALVVGPSTGPPITAAPSLTLPTPLPARTWDEIVAESRVSLVRAGADPEKISGADLFDDETLVRIEQEWATAVTDIDARLYAARTDALTAACRRSVIDAIVRPFGLGKIVSRMDKTGGGVLTMHNLKEARAHANSGGAEGVAASELADAARVQEHIDRMNQPFVRDDARERSEFRKEAFKGPAPEDAYQPEGTVLPKNGQAQVDHVLSLRELYDDDELRFFLSDDAVQRLANDDPNLAWTNARINQSKGARSLPEWLDQLRADGTTNAEHFGVDRERALARWREAADAKEAAVLSPKVRHYVVETAKSGAVEAAKMGVQQALGTLLVEVVVALFEEVAELVRHGAGSDGIVAELKARADRVVTRTFAARGEVIAAFEQGALGGLISAIVTTVINLFKTTCQRTVRLIREGALSLCRAVQVLASPPPGMDMAAAAHEASKIAAAALVVSGGVMIEQSVASAITATVPFLAPFAPALTAVTVGLATGLSTVLLVAMLDRFDLFGAVARERGEARRLAMNERIDGILTALLAANDTMVPR